MAKVQVSLLLLVAVCCLMAGSATAKFHIVGGAQGWTIPPNKTYFQDWAKNRVFCVTDKLFFPFRSALHNVVEVGAEDFPGCTQNKLINIYTNGPTTLNFTKPGDHYYYSGIGIQCEAGLKLHITVIDPAQKPTTGHQPHHPHPSAPLDHDHDHDHHHHHAHRHLLSADDAAVAPATAPAPATSAAAATIGGLGMVSSLVTFVAWLFL